MAKLHRKVISNLLSCSNCKIDYSFHVARETKLYVPAHRPNVMEMEREIKKACKLYNDEIPTCETEAVDKTKPHSPPQNWNESFGQCLYCGEQFVGFGNDLYC